MAHPAPRTAACVLGPQITVRGTLSGEEDLVVEGRLEGSVSLTGHLIVAHGGVVKADLEAVSIEVHGEVEGDLAATRSVTIEKGAHVHGNVRAPRVIIHDGAQFRGAVEMDVELPEALRSLVRG
jgi:cytoskeletal protein CcmA (bactofilin family)